MKKLGLGAALGAAATWLLDPTAGRRRRALLRYRTLAGGRRLARRSARAGRGVGARVYGLRQKVAHRHPQPKAFDDTTLKDKVESEIFRRPDAPKGQVNVNAQDGVIQLRGEVDSPELIEELVERARRVQGVRDVENLLHVPGAPAPMHQ